MREKPREKRISRKNRNDISAWKTCVPSDRTHCNLLFYLDISEDERARTKKAAKDTS